MISGHHASLSFTISQNLLKFTSIELVMLSNDLILCCLLLLLSSIFPASGSFQWVSSSHQVAKVLEIQLQHQSFYEYSGSISFRFDWFDLPTVQRTLQSLPQQRNLKASVLRCSAFFMVQLSHDYWKNHSFDCMDLWQQRDISAF